MPTVKKSKTYKCHICHDDEVDLQKHEVYCHESLHVSICPKCRNNHVHSSKWHCTPEWTDFDDRGKCIYCQICGEGGTLMCCDNAKCSHSYCLSCLKFWLGQSQLDEFLADDKLHFSCFVCTYKEGASGLNRIYPVYSKFIKDSEKSFEDNKYIDRTPKKKVESKIDKISENGQVSGNKAKRNGSIIPIEQEFTCFSCFEKHKYSKAKMPKLHKKFKVTMCDACYKFLLADDWTFTDGKSDFCVISGDGGEIISCDSKDCTNSFDVSILKKWMEKKELKVLLDDDEAQFKCFSCNPGIGKYKTYLDQTATFMNAFKNIDINKATISPKLKTEDLISPRKRAREDTNCHGHVRQDVKEVATFRIDENNKNKKTNHKKNMSESDAKKYMLGQLERFNQQCKDTETYKKMLKLCK